MLLADRFPLRGGKDFLARQMGPAQKLLQLGNEKSKKKYLVNWKKVAFSELCHDGGQQIG